MKLNIIKVNKIVKFLAKWTFTELKSGPGSDLHLVTESKFHGNLLDPDLNKFTFIFFLNEMNRRAIGESVSAILKINPQ